MATNLGKRELKLIVYFLGFTSKDIQTCKLLCKSWHVYLNQIIPLTSIQHEEEEEKESTPRLKTYSEYLKTSKTLHRMNYHNSIQIQRSQPLMVSTVPKPKGNIMVMTSNSSKLAKQCMHDMQEEYKSPPLIPLHRSVDDYRRINPSNFLQHSLEKAFWRLDQHTLDKMIASGNSPHIKQLKITQDLLTENEKQYIDRKHPHINNVSFATFMQSSPTLTASVHKKDSFSSIEDLKLSDDDENMKQILSKSIHWKPEYPLHLLQNDKSYKRAHNHQQHKKRMTDNVSLNVVRLKHKARLLPLTSSRSLTTKHMKQNKNISKHMTQSSTRLMTNSRRKHINALHSHQLPQIMNIKHQKSHAITSTSHDMQQIAHIKDVSLLSQSTDTDDINEECEIKENNNDREYTDIELAADATETNIGSNLSKSLLITQRDRINTDDSMMYYEANVVKREQIQRGYTIDSSDYNYNLRHVKRITPYELRKQHSLLRKQQDIIQKIASKEEEKRDISSISHKLRGPLYSVEEKEDWNNMKKVDVKYENVLKKRKKSNNIKAVTHLSINGSEESSYLSEKRPSFWGNLYSFFMGNKVKEDSYYKHDDDEISTQQIMSPNEIESTICTTSCVHDIETSDTVLTTPLLHKNDKESDNNDTKDDMQQISFWRDIIVPNWDLLHGSNVVQLFWEREGIPASCRGQVWFYAIGNRLNIALTSFDSFYAVTKQQMDEYQAFIDADDNKPKRTKSIFDMQQIQQHEVGETYHFCEGLKRKKSIERDITRLLEEEEDCFESMTKAADIVAVLMAFCNLRKSISYIQFLTHLTQILLHYQSPSVAFISLSNMINREIFEIYIHCNVAEIRKRIEIFTKMLVYNSSDIARHLQKLSISADTFVIDWCNGLFSAQLPINIVSRIWDLYFLNGEIIIWKAAVSLLIILNEKLLITNKSHLKLIKILQSIKQSLKSNNIKLDEQYFVKKIYSIKLPRDVRKWFKKKTKK